MLHRILPLSPFTSAPAKRRPLSPLPAITNLPVLHRRTSTPPATTPKPQHAIDPTDLIPTDQPHRADSHPQREARPPAALRTDFRRFPSSRTRTTLPQPATALRTLATLRFQPADTHADLPHTLLARREPPYFHRDPVPLRPFSDSPIPFRLSARQPCHFPSISSYPRYAPHSTPPTISSRPTAIPTTGPFRRIEPITFLPA